MPEEILSKSGYEIANDLLSCAVCQAGYRAAAREAYAASYAHLAAHRFLVGYQWQNTGQDHGGIVRHLYGHSDPNAGLVAEEMRKLKSLRTKAFYNFDLPFTKAMAEDALERAYLIIFELAT